MPGTTAHLGCQDLPKSLNDWPDGGRRQLSCLRSGRSLRSRAKLLCLGHACRGPTASPAPIAEIGGALVWPRDSSRLSPETGCRNPNPHLGAGIWQAQWIAAAREAAAAARAVRAVAIASAAGWIRERLRQLSHQQTIAATQRPVPKWRIVWTEQPMC